MRTLLALAIVSLSAAAGRALTLRSSAFRDGGSLPVLFTCDGENVSPPLAWDGVPDGARAMVLTMDDPDAPAGDWVHWVLYDVPPDPPRRTTAIGAGEEGRTWGVDSFSKTGYAGPCPPQGRPHRYIFTLYALSKATGLKAGATRPQVLAAIKATTLATAKLTAMFGR